MASLPERFRRDERGIAIVFVAMGMVALLGATTLAIDVGMLMTARTQTQSAADAGALAGAIALVNEDFNDRTATGPAVVGAISAATDTGNRVLGSSVSITPADVTFPLGPGGATNRVRVLVTRSAARGNPLSTFVAGIFGADTADMTAFATAEASPSNAATCTAPFVISDRWTERQTAPWDPGDTFLAYPSNPSLPADIYKPASDAAYTGYNAERDKGLRLTIKAGTGNNIEPSFYYGLAIPGSSGADDYQWNIENCNTNLVHFGDMLTAEPGNMVGPTKQGIEALIAKDPDAYWDATNKRVVSGMNPSPRVKVVPVFDPKFYADGKKAGRTADLKAANFIGIFVEGMQGNDVVARITPVTGVYDGSAGAAPQGAFTRAIRLVE
jgi:Flp pilus assembly protein TadG